MATKAKKEANPERDQKTKDFEALTVVESKAVIKRTVVFDFSIMVLEPQGLVVQWAEWRADAIERLNSLLPNPNISWYHGNKEMLVSAAMNGTKSKIDIASCPNSFILHCMERCRIYEALPFTLPGVSGTITAPKDGWAGLIPLAIKARIQAKLRMLSGQKGAEAKIAHLQGQLTQDLTKYPDLAKWCEAMGVQMSGPREEVFLGRLLFADFTPVADKHAADPVPMKCLGRCMLVTKRLF